MNTRGLFVGVACVASGLTGCGSERVDEVRSEAMSSSAAARGVTVTTLAELETPSAPSVRVEDVDGALVLRGDGVAASIRTRSGVTAAETRRARGEGYEQSWRFEAPLQRASVAVDVAGLQLDRADDAGLHLRGADGLRVRYGHGTWIDAAGRRTHVAAKWRDGAIALDVPDEVVASSTFPAVLDPEVYVEAQPRTFAVLPTSGLYPQVVPGGPGYLIWWTAAGTTTVFEGQRVDETGRLIDRTVFSVPSNSATPHIARTPTGWLVFSYSSSSGTQRVYELPGTGSPVWSVPPSLDGGGDVTLLDAVDDASCGASGCMTVGTWTGPSAFNLAGSIRDLRGRASASMARSRLRFSIASVAGPRVAPVGDAYLVAWADTTFGATTRDTRVVKVRSDGTLAEPTGHPVSAWGYDRAPACIASNGTTAVLIWAATRGTGSRLAGTYASALDADGNPVGDPTYLGASTATTCSLTWTGSQYVLARSGRLRLDASGHTLGDAGTVEPAAGDATGSATSMLVVNGTGVEVYRPDNTRVSSIAGLYGHIAGQGAPLLVSNGSDLLVTWSADRNLPTGVTSDGYRAMRVTMDAVASPTSTPVALPATQRLAVTRNALPLIGAFDGTGYQLMSRTSGLSSAGTLNTITVDRNGAALRAMTAASLVPGDYRATFDEMFNGADGFVVARQCRSLMWLNETASVTARSPYTAGMAPADLCAADADVIAGTTYFAFSSLLATGGGIYGIRFDHNGDPLDGVPRLITASSPGPFLDAVFGGGGRVLILSNDRMGHQFITEAMPDWTFVRTVALPAGAGWMSSVFDGTKHLLFTISDAGASTLLSMRRMSARGDLIDVTPVPVVTMPGIYSTMVSSRILEWSATSMGNGVTYVAYTRTDPSTASTRVSLLSISDSPTPDAGVMDAALPDVPAVDAAVDTSTPDVTVVDVASPDVPRDTAVDAAPDVTVVDVASPDVPRDAAVDTAPTVDAPRDVAIDALPTDVTAVDAPVSDVVDASTPSDVLAPSDDASTSDVVASDDVTTPDATVDAAGGGGGGGGQAGCQCDVPRAQGASVSPWWLVAVAAVSRRRRGATRPRAASPSRPRA